MKLITDTYYRTWEAANLADYYKCSNNTKANVKKITSDIAHDETYDVINLSLKRRIFDITKDL